MFRTLSGAIALAIAIIYPASVPHAAWLTKDGATALVTLEQGETPQDVCKLYSGNADTACVQAIIDGKTQKFVSDHGSAAKAGDVVSIEGGYDKLARLAHSQSGQLHLELRSAAPRAPPAPAVRPAPKPAPGAALPTKPTPAQSSASAGELEWYRKAFPGWVAWGLEQERRHLERTRELENWKAWSEPWATRAVELSQALDQKSAEAELASNWWPGWLWLVLIVLLIAAVVALGFASWRSYSASRRSATIEPQLRADLRETNSRAERLEAENSRLRPELERAQEQLKTANPKIEELQKENLQLSTAVANMERAHREEYSRTDAAGTAEHATEPAHEVGKVVHIELPEDFFDDRPPLPVEKRTLGVVCVKDSFHRDPVDPQKIQRVREYGIAGDEEPIAYRLSSAEAHEVIRLVQYDSHFCDRVKAYFERRNATI